MSVRFEQHDFQLLDFNTLLNIWPHIATFFILLGVTVVFIRPRTYGEFDIVGNKNDLVAAIKKGTELYPSSGFAIPTSPPLIILPLSMIDEIKSLPDKKVSAAPELFQRAAGHYSKLGTNAVAALKALRIDLKRKTTTASDLMEEAQYALDDTLGAYPEWTPLNVHPHIRRVVALVSDSVFVGKALSRQPEWNKTSSHFSEYVFALMRALQHYPLWLRPYVTPYLQETKELLSHRARAKALLEPSFLRHIEAKQNGSPVADDEEESLTSWVMKYVAPRHMTVEGLTRHQLAITWAAIHSTTYLMTQIVFDLAAHPEYQEILRQEIEAVLGAAPTDTENLAQATLPKLAKMDSFMKEVMRLNPNTIVTPLRMVVEPLTLSSGQTLQPGTSFGFPSLSINESTDLYSSPRPEFFDGLRFYRMRQKQGDEQKHQFGATGLQETFDFGHGIHACPGRFFATTEIKVLLIHILTRYDLRLKDGHRRPSNSLDEIWHAPDSTAEVLIKSRGVI